MDFAQLPVGFAMALARNNAALEAFAGMGPDQKRLVLEKARKARSEREMEQIVYTLADSPM